MTLAEHSGADADVLFLIGAAFITKWGLFPWGHNPNDDTIGKSGRNLMSFVLLFYSIRLGFQGFRLFVCVRPSEGVFCDFEAGPSGTSR